MNRLAKLLVCFVTASGGCATSTDESWAPPSGDGKADTIAFLKGSDIPSQFVDPNKTYIEHRFMYYLDQVGALTGAEKSAAEKADEILPYPKRDEQLSVAELVKLEQTPGALTSAELAAMPALWSLLEIPDEMHHFALPQLSVEDRSVPYSEAVLAVTEPGPHVTTLALGGITFTHKMNVSVREYRNWRPGFIPIWSANVFLGSGASLTVETTGGDLIVRHLGGSGEVLHGPHPNWDYTNGGDFVIERFVSGQFIERFRVITPPDLTVGHQLTLSADYALELADGTPLVRSLETITTSGSDPDVSATFTFDRTAKPQPQVAPDVLGRLATPVSSLASGRYRIDIGGRTVTLELYPSGVVPIEGQPAKAMLRDTTKMLYWSDPPNHTSFEFVPTTNRLRLVPTNTGAFDPAATSEVTVTSAMRIP